MYKTVRHGENSLQYTILPQTEEVLNNGGLKGKGRDYSPSIHIRRSRRRSTVKYISLIIFGIIVALALASVPLFVMNGALYARKNHQDQHEVITTAPFGHAGREIAKTRKKELKILPDIIATIEPKLATSTSAAVPTTTTTVLPTVISERVTSPPWMPMPALKLWNTLTPSTSVRPIPTEEKMSFVGTSGNNNRLQSDNKPAKSWEKDIIIRPTMTPEPITLRNIIKHYSRFVPSEKLMLAKTKVYDDVLITTKGTTTRTPVTTEFTTTSENYNLRDLKDTILSVDDDVEFKESLEEDEVFSLPPLKSDPAAAGDSDEVTVAKAGDSSWYGARWPFVDTSSYFQWTGYSPGDNLLLPLLVAALSSIALVLLLALAVRRRKRSHTATGQIGQLTAELQADDNTNLLTAENAEDAEE